MCNDGCTAKLPCNIWRTILMTLFRGLYLYAVCFETQDLLELFVRWPIYSSSKYFARSSLYKIMVTSVALGLTVRCQLTCIIAQWCRPSANYNIGIPLELLTLSCKIRFW